MHEARINVRVDKDLKENAEALFSQLGMNMSTAIAVFLRKAIEEQEIPFIVGTKALSYAETFTSSQITKLFKEAVTSEISNKVKNVTPIAKYDINAKKAYLEYADGKKEYISNE